MIKYKGENLKIIALELLSKIKQQYRLKWNGTHGVIQWNLNLYLIGS